MKVCTDACLFGAWVADKIERKKIEPKNILDIGAGTGLLSIMLAQKTAAHIDAIEIDEAAFLQSTENVSASPWNDRIKIHHSSATDFSASNKFDLIISNPPFYENQLRSDDEKRNAAMHDTTLSFDELSSIIKVQLTKDGIAAILVPFDRVNALEVALYKCSLFINEKTNVSHSPKHRYFRTMVLISSEKTAIRESLLAIKGNTGSYSEEFTALLTDYYLAM